MSATPDHEDYDDFFTEEEGDGWSDFDCHWMPGTGQCMAAGSEDCDFECPYRDDYQRESERLYREQEALPATGATTTQSETENGSSVAESAASVASQPDCSTAPLSDGSDGLDPSRWEVDVRVCGEPVLTIGSHGYLSGREDIDRFGDAVRSAALHLRNFIGKPAPVGHCSLGDEACVCWFDHEHCDYWKAGPAESSASGSQGSERCQH